jgi:hypothetical protein
VYTSVQVLVRRDGPEDTSSAFMALWDVVLCDYCCLTAHSAAFLSILVDRHPIHENSSDTATDISCHKVTRLGIRVRLRTPELGIHVSGEHRIRVSGRVALAAVPPSGRQLVHHNTEQKVTELSHMSEQ